MRIMDLIAPIGKGQRGLIVSPPRAGKTILLQKIANAIVENHPEVTLIMLLIDERPEEVTDTLANVDAEVIASTFDEEATRHVQVADMVIETGEAARREQEGRRHPARLDHSARARAQHGDAAVGQDSLGRRRREGSREAEEVLRRGAQHRGRRLAHDHRHRAHRDRLAHGRSDLRGVQGHGQHGARARAGKIAERRVYPAIDIGKSGTRKEELLFSQEELNRVYLLRNFLADMPEAEAMEFLLKQMSRSKNNKEFFQQMAQG